MLTEREEPGPRETPEIKQTELTAELVRQVTDKVYQWLLRDLRLAQERRRPFR